MSIRADNREGPPFSSFFTVSSCIYCVFTNVASNYCKCHYSAKWLNVWESACGIISFTSWPLVFTAVWVSNSSRTEKCIKPMIVIRKCLSYQILVSSFLSGLLTKNNQPKHAVFTKTPKIHSMNFIACWFTFCMLNVGYRQAVCCQEKTLNKYFILVLGSIIILSLI